MFMAKEEKKAAKVSEKEAKHKKEAGKEKHAAKASVEPVAREKQAMKEIRTAEKKPAKVKTKEQLEAEIRGLDLLRHPLITEKAVNMIESENKLTFVVDKSATKEKVRSAVESLYNVKVSGVNIVNDMKARKKAIVALTKEFKAGDVATKLGVV